MMVQINWMHQLLFQVVQTNLEDMQFRIGFLRLFSLFVINFVKDPFHRVWQMYLNLKCIVEILTAKSITHEQIAYVNVCIEEYLSDRCQLFPDNPLKPKHHFLLHYPELTLSFGPLIHLWTMRFESKHTYFKLVPGIFTILNIWPKHWQTGINFFRHITQLVHFLNQVLFVKKLVF